MWKLEIKKRREFVTKSFSRELFETDGYFVFSYNNIPTSANKEVDRDLVYLYLASQQYSQMRSYKNFIFIAHLSSS